MKYKNPKDSTILGVFVLAKLFFHHLGNFLPNVHGDFLSSVEIIHANFVLVDRTIIEKETDAIFNRGLSGSSTLHNPNEIFRHQLNKETMFNQF